MGKHAIALITDSTCDIPENLIQQYDITVIPEIVIWGEETLRDRVDITPEAFYQRLETDPRHPSTTLPSPADFEKVYQDAIEGGAQNLLVATVSSAMSGTYQLAKQIGDKMSVPVYVIDSKGPTMSLGWQVLAAARAREAGSAIEGMIAAAERVRQKLVQIVCLDTLEYLHRGGRIGTATKFIGSLLDLKPLVRINHQSGLVEPAGRVLVEARFRVGDDRFGGAFRFADTAINALVGVDDEHVLAFVEAIHRTYLHAIHIFALYAIVGNNISHEISGGHGRPGR